MNWAKTTRYQTSIKLGAYTYNVMCESDFDDGYAVYINKQFITDVDSLPTMEEMIDIISDNIEIESTIKEGYLAAGVFDGLTN